MLCTIIYLEHSDKAIFDDLRKRVENDCVTKKAEYPRTVTAGHSLMLNYQPNYNSNINSQYKRFSNQIMFAQCGKTGDNE